jgi:hypothetical protein
MTFHEVHDRHSAFTGRSPTGYMIPYPPVSGVRPSKLPSNRLGTSDNEKLINSCKAAERYYKSELVS